MKLLLLALLLFALAPSSALGASTTMASRDVSAGVNKPPHRFDLVGLHWRGSGSVSFRTRSLAGRWSSWHDAAPEDDGPDAGTREPRGRGWELGSPYWTGPADRLQVRTVGRVTRVRAFYVRSKVTRRPLRAVSMAGSPLILSRAAWGASERIRRGGANYADSRAVRRRPPHRGLELLHACPVCFDRPRHPALPRARERLERHRLQLPRRQVRPGLRGPVRRSRPQRRRSARPGVQPGLDGRGADRELRRHLGDAGGEGYAHASSRLAPGRGPRRSDDDLQLALDREPKVFRGANDHAAHDRRASRHGLHGVSGEQSLRRAALAHARRLADGAPEALLSERHRRSRAGWCVSPGHCRSRFRGR